MRTPRNYDGLAAAWPTPTPVARRHGTALWLVLSFALFILALVSFAGIAASGAFSPNGTGIFSLILGVVFGLGSFFTARRWARGSK